MHWRTYFQPNPSMVLGIEIDFGVIFLFWRWLCTTRAVAVESCWVVVGNAWISSCVGEEG